MFAGWTAGATVLQVWEPYLITTPQLEVLSFLLDAICACGIVDVHVFSRLQDTRREADDSEEALHRLEALQRAYGARGMRVQLHDRTFHKREWILLDTVGGIRVRMWSDLGLHFFPAAPVMVSTALACHAADAGEHRADTSDSGRVKAGSCGYTPGTEWTAEGTGSAAVEPD